MVGSQGKHSKDPYVGNCDVVRLIQVEIEAAPWLCNLHLCPSYHEKTSRVSSARSKQKPVSRVPA